MDRFSQWLAVNAESLKHRENAFSAGMAYLAEIGNDRIVKKHLKRIEDRENLLASFADIVSDSPALREEDDWEEE